MKSWNFQVFSCDNNRRDCSTARALSTIRERMSRYLRMKNSYLVKNLIFGYLWHHDQLIDLLAKDPGLSGYHAVIRRLTVSQTRLTILFKNLSKIWRHNDWQLIFQKKTSTEKQVCHNSEDWDSILIIQSPILTFLRHFSWNEGQLFMRKTYEKTANLNYWLLNERWRLKLDNVWLFLNNDIILYKIFDSILHNSAITWTTYRISSHPGDLSTIQRYPYTIVIRVTLNGAKSD